MRLCTADWDSDGCRRALGEDGEARNESPKLWRGCSGLIEARRKGVLLEVGERESVLERESLEASADDRLPRSAISHSVKWYRNGGVDV